MKKNILIYCSVLATFTLMAFNYINWNELVVDKELNVSYSTGDIDLIYKVESRFMTRVTKEKLNQANSIVDILPKEATQSIDSYETVEISVLSGCKDISAFGNGANLNIIQKTLLQSADYSTNFYIKAYYKTENSINCNSKDDHLVYYMTVIPEKEATYSAGHDALIAYLKENSKEKTAIIKRDQLKPGQVNFTVTDQGTIAKVKLTSTSGYESVDHKLVELITNMPGTWNPATNSKGKNVNQELVFFFGLQGC